MLKQLKLTDFKQHSALLVDFERGLNQVTGPNYSGKTSILHGVLVALFGVSAIPGGSKVATRFGAEGFTVELTFEAEGHVYEVRRTKGSVRLKKDGEPIATSASAVTEEIERILGMSKKRFLQMKYGEQGQIQALLTLGAAELHRIIEEVSGAETVNDILGRVRDVGKASNAVLAGLPAADLQELTTQFEAAQTHHDELGASLDTAAEAEGQARAEHTFAKGLYQEAVAQNRERARILEAQADHRLKLQTHRARLADLQKELDTFEALPDVEALRRQKESLWERAKAAERKRDAVEKAEETRALTDRQVLKAREKLEELAEITPQKVSGLEVEAAWKKLEENKEDYRRFKQDLEQAEDGLKDAVCHACQRPLDAEHEAELRAKVEQYRPLVERAKADYDHWRQEHARLEAAQKKWDEWFRDRTVAEQRLQEMEEALALAEQEVDELGVGVLRDEEIVSLWASHQALVEEIAAVEAKQLRLTALTESLETEQAAYDRLQRTDHEKPPEAIDTDPLAVDLKTAEQALSAAMDRHSDLKVEFERSRSKLAALRKELKDAEAVETERRKHQKRAELAKKLAKYLEQNRDRFIASVWAGVMGYVSHFCSTATGGVITEVKRNADGDFVFTADGVEQPLEAASGCQKSLMGIGLQLSLSKMLPSAFRVTMLDEPTDSLDESHAIALSALLGADGSQVVVVSHAQVDASVAANMITLEG